MTQFIYKEMPMDFNRDLITQINEQGKIGWQFKTQAQKMSPVRGLNGIPKQTIVIIYEKAIEVPASKDKN